MADLLSFKVVVERHEDGYVAWPLGIEGIVVGEGDTYDEALADVRSAIATHIQVFGTDVLDMESPVLDATITDVSLPC